MILASVKEQAREEKALRRRWAWALACLTLAGSVRFVMAGRMPVEADEPAYLRAAYRYAVLLRQGDIEAIPSLRENPEHPALVKLLYSLAWLIPAGDRWLSDALWGARLMSVLFGAAAAGLMAWIQPAAGLLLALHPLTAYYTSAALLESMPQFLALLAVLSWRPTSRRGACWSYLGAFALGATGAAKWVYALPLFPASIGMLRRSRSASILFALVAAVSFVALNPPMWTDPLGYLREAIRYHFAYSASEHVRRYAFPWYQPFLWLSRSLPEALILILGLVGAVRGLFGSAFRKRVAWGALSAMAFLLAWPTKWPHYVLVATPFLSLTASDALIRGRRARVLLSAIGLLSMTVSVRMIMGQRPYLEPDLLAHRIPKPFDARWEGIRLEGLRWEGTEAREGVPSLVVCWRPERSADSNLSVFVHLLGETPNPRTGSPLWSQVDAQPLGGAYPATRWVPGVVFCDRYRIARPPDLPPGIYLLTTGWYRWEDGYRIPLREGPQDLRYPDALVIGRWVVSSAGE